MTTALPCRGLQVLVLCALLAAQWTFSPGSPRAEAVAFPRTALKIVTGDGLRHDLTVEVARTPAQLSRGLMYRTRLAPDRGMLFLYPAPQIARMWMKDTPVSLDMLFIAADGTVLEIAEHTEPLSLRTIASKVPVAAVLELKAGRCAELGIGPGAKVLHREFGPPAVGGSAR